MKLKSKPPESEHLELTPLIDIIFQLVIFFMIASTFVEDYGFNITVPRVGKPDVIAADAATWVLVRADGAVAAEPGAASYADLNNLVADLRRQAAEKATAGQPAIVVIKADRAVPFERVVHVWNAVRAAGIGQISFKLEADRS